MAQSLSRKIKLKRRSSLFKFKGSNNNYASKLRRQKIFDYFRDDFKCSTIHGLPYIANEEIHWIERAFWVVSVFASSILSLYLLAAQYARFIESPTVASVEMDYYNWNVSYPAFTLCPDNEYKIDAEAFSFLLEHYKTKTKEDPEQYLRGILTANMRTLSQESIEFRDLELIDPRNYSSLAASFFTPLDNTSLTTNHNWAVTVDAAMTELGMCHVLNSNVAIFDDPLQWGKNIAYVKDNIELSVHDRDFFTQMMNYAEVYKVYIHSPDETILATTSSYTQYMRGFSSIGVQVWTTRISEELSVTSLRLRRCRFITEPLNKRYKIYSYNHCLLECRIQMIITLCGCVPHFYKPLESEKVCNIAELQCVLQHKRDILALAASEMTLIQFMFTNKLPRSSRDCNCLSECETDIYQKDYETFVPQSALSRLRISISHFPRIRVIRDIIFSWEDTILKVGGVWNLCLGATVLSLVEFWLPIIRVSVYLLTKKLKKLWNTFLN